MLHSKLSKFAILAAVGLLMIGASRPTLAQLFPFSGDTATEWSGNVINLGSTFSEATGINATGQVVGDSWAASPPMAMPPSGVAAT